MMTIQNDGPIDPLSTDYWDDIVQTLKRKKEKVKITIDTTARLVKSDLNFHLFFQTLLSLLQKNNNNNKTTKQQKINLLFSLKDTLLSLHRCIHLHLLQKKKRIISYENQSPEYKYLHLNEDKKKTVLPSFVQ